MGSVFLSAAMAMEAVAGASGNSTPLLLSAFDRVCSGHEAPPASFVKIEALAVPEEVRAIHPFRMGGVVRRQEGVLSLLMTSAAETPQSSFRPVAVFCAVAVQGGNFDQSAIAIEGRPAKREDAPSGLARKLPADLKMQTFVDKEGRITVEEKSGWLVVTRQWLVMPRSSK